MGGRRCEGYGVCSDAAQQHFALGKMLGGRSAVKKVREDFFDKLKGRSYPAFAFLCPLELKLFFEFRDKVVAYTHSMETYLHLAGFFIIHGGAQLVVGDEAVVC